MQLKSRIKKIEQALERRIADEAGAFLTLEQWKRHADGEGITAEIPEAKRVAFAEWERKADERLRQAEEIYAKHNL